jgi:hypothetical protein
MSRSLSESDNLSMLHGYRKHPSQLTFRDWKLCPKLSLPSSSPQAEPAPQPGHFPSERLPTMPTAENAARRELLLRGETSESQGSPSILSVSDSEAASEFSPEVSATTGGLPTTREGPLKDDTSTSESPLTLSPAASVRAE